MENRIGEFLTFIRGEIAPNQERVRAISSFEETVPADVVVPNVDQYDRQVTRLAAAMLAEELRRVGGRHFSVPEKYHDSNGFAGRASIGGRVSVTAFDGTLSDSWRCRT
jgi:hypothetical protein